MSDSYQNDKLKFEFELKNALADGSNVVTIEEAKSTVSFSAFSGSSANMATVRIFNLSLEYIAALTNKNVNQFQTGEDGFNVISIFFNDSLVFKGGIYRAYSDINTAPDYSIELEASGTVVQQSLKSIPFSYKGQISVEEALSVIGNQVGVKVVNYGVQTTLTNPHYSKNAIASMIEICEDTNTNYAIEWNKFIIWKDNTTYPVVTVSPEFGLIGYPVFQENGIQITTQYSDLLRLGGLIDLTTDLPSASGQYIISTLEHNLASWVVGGRNTSIITAVKQQVSL